MKKLLIILFLSLTSLVAASPPFFPTFTPPKGWLIADPSKLEEDVQIGFIESTHKLFSPSITLTLEKVGNTDLSTYLEAVINHYKADRTNTCRELGSLTTSIGKSSLLQIDMKNQWGNIRVLQAITIQNGYALIHTAVCMKEDFNRVSETFLNAFKSLSTSPSVIESIDNSTFRTKVKDLQTSWNKYTKTTKGSPQTLFNSAFFQNNQWIPLVTYIEKDLAKEGACWQFLALKFIKDSLMETVK